MNSAPRRQLVGILWLILCACLALPAYGWHSDAPTPNSVEAKIAELESSLSITEDTKSSAVSLLKPATDLLKKADEFSNKTTQFRQLANEAPQLLASIRDELRLPPPPPTIKIPEGASLTQLEQTKSQASASLQAARQTLLDLQAETIRRDEQRTALTERLVLVRQELIDIQSTNEAAAEPEIPIEISEAQSILRKATIIVHEKEIEAIEAEMNSYDARRELLPARRDRAQRRASEAQSLVEAWQIVITNRRQIEGEQAVQEANKLRREAARQHPVLKNFAEESVIRANSLVSVQPSNGTHENYAQRLVNAKTKLDSLKSQFTSIQSRLSASGLNRATGLLLRQQYESIPDVSELKKEVASTQKLLDNLDYTLIELQEERVQAGDVDQVAQALIAKMPEAEIENNRAETLQIARELASARRDLLDKLIGDSTNNFYNLVELNTILRETTETTRSYTNFIEERILWVRSISSGRAPNLGELNSSIQWMINPVSWEQSWTITKSYVMIRWVDILVAATSLLIIWLISIRCRVWLLILGERVSRYSTDSFRYTLLALLLTAVIAAPVATAFLMVGWLLRSPVDQVKIVSAAGYGLYVAAYFLYPLTFFRHLLRPGGLAIAHFKWSKDTASPIRNNLRWFIPVVVPLVLLVNAIDISGDELANATLGRILFTVELLVLTVFLHKILRPTGAVLNRFIESNSQGWIYRSRYIWYLLAVILPLVFAILSWLGYHYTALQLQSRLVQSLILVLILVVVNDILHRWLYVARRRVAVEDARRRRAIANAESESEHGSGESHAPTSITIDEEKLDLPALSVQTKQIFRTAIVVSAILGLFVIWAQALPALKMFDRLQVWPKVQIVDSSASLDSSTILDSYTTKTGSQPKTGDSTPSPIPSAGLIQSDISAGDSQAPQSNETVSITVADIGFSIIVITATWISFRNIPGLIEIVVLQRLPLDAGSRYALSTVIRYLIVMFGLMIAFQAIGISWSNVQWLAAALTFGLAFGLQEIFANFVSGLIILAERPIRLGDTVTVGGVSGTVMRIRMRATTISDWDRKELVIPNKNFITGDVINWTLTDSILRVKVLVGVSYSSDVDQVEMLLKQVAKDNSTVLQTPEPSVLFKAFGDSSLSFELRVFIPHIDFYMPITHELHNSIFKAFQQANIEISFPQRDLHIRSITDLRQLVDHDTKSDKTT